MRLYRGTHRVEDRPQHILGRIEQGTLADCLAIRAESLVQSVHVDDESEAPEGAVSQLVGRNAEVPVVNVEEPSVHIDEEPVAPSDLV